MFAAFAYRTGKRTVFGLLKDGVNASFRYFVNNFYDGYRQVHNYGYHSNQPVPIAVPFYILPSFALYVTICFSSQSNVMAVAVYF